MVNLTVQSRKGIFLFSHYNETSGNKREFGNNLFYSWIISKQKSVFLFSQDS